MTQDIVTRRSVKPVSRHCGVEAYHGGRLLTIIQEGQEDYYILDEIPVDFGRAFRLEKHDGTVYTVTIQLPGMNGRPSCSCKGHARWKHCKHQMSLAALDKHGKI